MEKIRITTLLVILLVPVVSCKTYKMNKTDQWSRLNSIQTLTFDNKVSIDNIVDLGMITAVASVTQTITKNEIICESKFFKLTYFKKNREVEYREGSRFLNGMMQPLTAVASTKIFGILYKSGAEKETIKIHDAKKLAFRTANYLLLEQAKTKGAMAIMLPQYSYDVQIDETGTKCLIFGGRSPKESVRKYTVKVVARAVNFKATKKIKE